MTGSKNAPHVLVFCVDALRADSVAAEPGPSSIWRDIGKPRTPAMEEFAHSARSYSTAVSASSWTKPAVPSMFLSLHPSEHGVLEVAKEGAGVTSPSLPASVPTLAELFAASGYHTLGLAHNAQMDPSLGFSRGFETFDADAGSGAEILGRLREARPFHDGRPVFLYVHLIEPHWPFGEPVRERADSLFEGRFPFHTYRAAEWKDLKRGLKKGELILTPEELRFLRRSYGLAVEEADTAVGDLLDWVREEGAADRAVTLLTADHGEELMDHGLVGHGQSLYEELVRVPFLLQTGAGTPEGPIGGTVTEPVSHVDLAPTLLDAAGLEPARHSAGRSVLDPTNAGGPVYSEVKHKRRYHQAIHTGRWKLIRSFFFRKPDDDTEPEDYNNLVELFESRPYRTQRKLFQLDRDPSESVDVFEKFPETADRMETALDIWWEQRRPRRREEDAQKMETELIRRLEALGYL